MKKRNRKHSIIDGLLRLLSNQILGAINKLSEEQLEELDFETLSKNAIALTRAAAYKKRIEVTSKDVLENGIEQFQSLLFETMAKDNPTLYKEFKSYIKSKTKDG